MKKLKTVISVLLGKYVIVRKRGITVLVETDLDREQQRKAACLFFKEAHSTI